MDRAVDVRISGRVQGVSFRYHTQERAEHLGVRGWVRNEPDGTVAGHFEGSAEAVEALVAWCRDGPRHAYVEGVAVTESKPAGATGFVVRSV